MEWFYERIFITELDTPENKQDMKQRTHMKDTISKQCSTLQHPMQWLYYKANLTISCTSERKYMEYLRFTLIPEMPCLDQTGKEDKLSIINRVRPVELVLSLIIIPNNNNWSDDNYTRNHPNCIWPGKPNACHSIWNQVRMTRPIQCTPAILSVERKLM